MTVGASRRTFPPAAMPSPVTDSGLQLEFLRDASTPTPGRHPLAVVVHDQLGGPITSALTVRPRLAALTPDAPAELWSTAEPAQHDEDLGFRLAWTDDVLFGAAELDGDDLEDSARRVYRALIEIIETRGYPHLLRVWNVVPRIGAPAPGGSRLDRYMLFCRGRAATFESAYGSGFEARLCAGTAVGSDSGPLSVWFIASPTEGEHRENPRQVEAYRYPKRYGPQPPAFARATLAPVALGTGLFVSGTASVVGSHSMHPGDLEAQVEETLRNIGALIGSDDAPEAEDVPYLRVYVRHAGDVAAIRARLAPYACGGTQVTYLRADICRPELLVEIEGLARHRREPSQLRRRTDAGLHEG